jgi:hypothetical protein
LFVVVIASPFPKNTKKLKGRNGEDWATKAKAWAATKYVAENQRMQQHAISTSRNENHNYGYLISTSKQLVCQQKLQNLYTHQFLSQVTTICRFQ